MSPPPRLVDAHAHLGDACFDDDRDEVLERAREAGVKAVVTVGETLDDALKNLELAGQHDAILPTAGLYPTVLDPGQADALVALIRSQRDRLVAIGEVGLDHWKVQDAGEREIQAEIFSRFIALSRETGLPLNVHSRSAARPTVEQLLAEGAEKVLLHAFDGRAAKALPALEAGYYFSVPPSIVRSRQKQKLVQRLPLNRILLETDSPVLGPDRESRNEPANVRISLAAIAEIKDVSEEEVVEAVVASQSALFGV
ncbi:MAG: TatD family hydrolase [Thermoanaerobaculia bacterium]|nr:TatD family hydrolase [Thermoanaerobaculia bacterium]